MRTTTVTDPDARNDQGLPVGWTELDEDSEAFPSNPDPRPAALYSREGHDVSVHVFAADPNMPHADTDHWRVAVVSGDYPNPERVDPIADVEGRDVALEVAEEFMAAFDAAEGPNRLERAMEAVSR